MRVRTADEGRTAVQLLKRRGVDLIKVHNFTPREVFFAIADEARRQNLPVVGHVPLKVTIQEGIDAGMMTIEHLSEDGRVWKACSGGAQYRADAGMSPLSALQTATLNPARYLGMEQTLGSIAVGKRADLVLLDANPLTDVANVRRIRAVVLGGRLLDRTALETLLAQARAAATQ